MAHYAFQNIFIAHISVTKIFFSLIINGKEIFVFLVNTDVYNSSELNI